jgi:hypothetical protein
MDSLLDLSNLSINRFTGLELLPQYTYWRLYQKDNDLKKHIDRISCEVSMTVCLGFDVSNVNLEKYPNYQWPMWIKDLSGKEIPINMAPGDMIIYRGCEVEHWREKFKGLNQAQVFMHYNDANGPFKQIYDNRSMLGIPKNS